MKISPEALDFVRRFMQEQIPFNAYLGLQVDLLEAGRARLSVPFRPEFIGDPFRPALHGGVISTVIDTCGGAAIYTTVDPLARLSTIDLRVDYLLPGRPEALVCEAKVIRSGRRVGVASMRAFHASAPDQTIAEGKGVYYIRPAGHEPREPRDGGRDPGRSDDRGPGGDPR
jgi:uncharacterized protein (TIGR00369 family)